MSSSQSQTIAMLEHEMRRPHVSLSQLVYVLCVGMFWLYVLLKACDDVMLSRRIDGTAMFIERRTKLGEVQEKVFHFSHCVDHCKQDDKFSDSSSLKSLESYLSISSQHCIWNALVVDMCNIWKNYVTQQSHKLSDEQETNTNKNRWQHRMGYALHLFMATGFRKEYFAYECDIWRFGIQNFAFQCSNL